MNVEKQGLEPTFPPCSKSTGFAATVTGFPVAKFSQYITWCAHMWDNRYFILLSQAIRPPNFLRAKLVLSNKAHSTAGTLSC